MARFTRGFTGRNRGARDPRLPPGQYDTGSSWPVLTAEATPRLSTAEWSFGVEGLVEHPTTWTWDEIHALTPSTYEGSIHCVTTWSKFGMTFTGVGRRGPTNRDRLNNKRHTTAPRRKVIKRGSMVTAVTPHAQRL